MRGCFAAELYKMSRAYWFWLSCVVLLMVYISKDMYFFKITGYRQQYFSMVSDYSFPVLVGIIFNAMFLGYEFHERNLNKAIYAGKIRMHILLNKLILLVMVGVTISMIYGILRSFIFKTNVLSYSGFFVLTLCAIYTCQIFISFVFKDIIWSASIPALIVLYYLNANRGSGLTQYIISNQGITFLVSAIILIVVPFITHCLFRNAELK